MIISTKRIIQTSTRASQSAFLVLDVFLSSLSPIELLNIPPNTPPSTPGGFPCSTATREDLQSALHGLPEPSSQAAFLAVRATQSMRKSAQPKPREPPVPRLARAEANRVGGEVGFLIWGRAWIMHACSVQFLKADPRSGANGSRNSLRFFGVGQGWCRSKPRPQDLANHGAELAPGEAFERRTDGWWGWASIWGVVSVGLLGDLVW